MKCFLNNLLGLQDENGKGNEVCTPMTPILRSLISSVLFIAVMVIVLNKIH